MRVCALVVEGSWPGTIVFGTGSRPRTQSALGSPRRRSRGYQWYLVDQVTHSVLEEANILDVAISDVSIGAPLYVDVVVKCTYSTDPAVLRCRARPADARPATERQPKGGGTLRPGRALSPLPSTRGDGPRTKRPPSCGSWVLCTLSITKPRTHLRPQDACGRS